MINLIMMLVGLVVMLAATLWAVKKYREGERKKEMKFLTVVMAVVSAFFLLALAVGLYQADSNLNRLAKMLDGEETTTAEISDMEEFFSGRTTVRWDDPEAREFVHQVWLKSELLQLGADADDEIVYRHPDFYYNGAKVDMGDVSSILEPTSEAPLATDVGTGEPISDKPGVAWDGPKD